jgi:hypothetical protein
MAPSVKQRKIAILGSRSVGTSLPLFFQSAKKTSLFLSTFLSSFLFLSSLDALMGRASGSCGQQVALQAQFTDEATLTTSL